MPRSDPLMTARPRRDVAESMIEKVFESAGTDAHGAVREKRRMRLRCWA
jgi:hypothetical protein